MGKGPDLTGVERAIIHAKILANWDSKSTHQANLMVSGLATSIISAVSWRAMAGTTTNRLTMVVESASEIPDLPSTFRST